MFCFSFFSLIFSPSFSGSESHGDFDFDGNDNNDGGAGGFEIFGLPILLPYADYRKGRKLIMLRPGIPTFVAAVPLVKPMAKPLYVKGKFLSQDQLVSIDNELLPPPVELMEENKQEPQVELVPDSDKYGRRIVHLDHGSCDNPFLVQDHSTFNIGLLAGMSFVDPNSYVVQYNVLMKAMFTSSGNSERLASNHNDAKDMKKLKTPTKPKHFDKWEPGDNLRESGMMAVALYAGVSVVSPDVRAGGVLIGKWTKDIQKLDENLVRVAFTRGGGFGITGRIQALPLTKIEGTALKDWDGTLVYTFDRSTEEGRKALKNALHNKVIVAQDSDEDNVTLLTRRATKQKKISKNLQGGIPFLVRGRMSWHQVKMSQSTANQRNGKQNNIASKGYFKQRAYRHINLPKTNKHKKWKHFAYTNQHYNKIAEGTARVIKNQEEKTVKRSDLRLAMEISFSNDKVKVKKVRKYNKRIGERVGVNDFVIDTDYKKKKQIGYVGISYKLLVNTPALKHVIDEAVEDKHLFDMVANDLIDTYFDKKDDPHSICRGTLKNKNLCVALIRFNTKRKLDKISSDLRKLHKSKIIKSKSKSSTLLAKISRRLRTNQFVLQSFISKLPPNPNGYGTFSIEGERFLGKKFIVDPNNQREIVDDINPDDDLMFDVNDAFMRDEDYDMF